MSRKKLIEVALPLEAISIASRRDKDRKVGTIKNVHKWFAPMPTPAWRALLFAALIDDPEEATERAELLRLVERLVPEDGTAPDAKVLTEARRWLESADPLPTVLDPFCGGGSTIVEAQRLGLPAVGSDLNPVPVLITRTLCQLVPQVSGRGPIAALSETLDLTAGPLDGFLADVRHYAHRVRDMVWEQVGALYPEAPGGGTVIAWLWARTFTCPNPACGALIPMYSSPWLSKRRNEERWIRPIVDRRAVIFEIGEGKTEPPEATKVGRARFRCLACGEVAPEQYTHDELDSGRGGTQLIAIVVERGDGRKYVPSDDDHAAIALLKPPLDGPAEQSRGTWASNAQGRRYGFKVFADYFTSRQLHALGSFSDAVAQVEDWVIDDGGDKVYAKAVASVLGLCVGKLAQSNSSQVRWNPRSGGSSKAEPAFSRQGLLMLWDFAEVNPFGGSVGDWLGQVDSISQGLRSLPHSDQVARVEQRDARSAVGLVPAASALVATDPPYYGQIGYADLSDYFYVWERRALRQVHPDLYRTILTPKDDELIAARHRHAGSDEAARAYFVEGFTQVFHSLAAASHPDLPIMVVYAHRQEESSDDEELGSSAWDAMLEALLAGGLGIVGTWPVHATSTGRQIGQGKNALASYVVMVCRRRDPGGEITDRQGFIRALRTELPEPLRILQDASMLPFDLTQAVIGPGMAIFSRFRKVVEPSGEPMRVRTAIGLIHQVRSEVLSELDDEFDAETRWAVQWFERFAFNEGPFGDAEQLFVATATSFAGLRDSGIIGNRSGKVWLRAPEDLPSSWDAVTDSNMPVWEVTTHLLRALDEGGEQAAAGILAATASRATLARDLAYRIADICERNQWSHEALAVNALVQSWPQIAQLAALVVQDQGTLL